MTFKIFSLIFVIILLIQGNTININSTNLGMKVKSSRIDKIRKAFVKYNEEYLLYISKRDFYLYIYNRKYKIIKKFRVAYGYNKDRSPKLYEGDMRTPEGLYEIIDILSLEHDRESDTFKELQELNDLHLKAEDGFFRFDNPNVDLGKNAYGPRMFRINYPNIDDILKYEIAMKNGNIPPDKEGENAGIGFGIAIHGNNYPKSIGNLASAGCILMHNRDIVELDKFVKIGTPVIISTD